ncbi:hypothetical protein JCM24511_02383 [Saitozyma sp. JCM 24511]|nr:hypothetical protein JCM24511_02383 [Saitozyma sp. JCM 24511]
MTAPEPPVSTPPIRTAELLRVLQRAKQQDDLGVKIASAMALIQSVLDDLGESAVAISFNGGKDCTVLLHLLAAVLLARHSNLPADLAPSTASAAPDAPSTPAGNVVNGHAASVSSIPLSPPSRQSHDPIDPIEGPTTAPPPLPSSTNLSSSNFPGPSSSNSAPFENPTYSSTSTSAAPPHPSSATHHPPHTPHPYPPIKSVYITAPNPFPSLDAFVLASAERYGMDLWRFGGGMKAALEEYLGCGGGKGVKGVLVGTRRGDPNGEVPELAPTDPSWPSFLRVHPILSWSYADIWTFLRELDVEWCHLYDEGYTSLGSTINTVPNPLLRNPSAPGGWDPAWKLLDESQERAGRLDSSS